jgi:hypothetical protein
MRVWERVQPCAVMRDFPQCEGNNSVCYSLRPHLYNCPHVTALVSPLGSMLAAAGSPLPMAVSRSSSTAALMRAPASDAVCTACPGTQPAGTCCAVHWETHGLSAAVMLLKCMEGALEQPRVSGCDEQRMPGACAAPGAAQPMCSQRGLPPEAAQEVRRRSLQTAAKSAGAGVPCRRGGPLLWQECHRRQDEVAAPCARAAWRLHASAFPSAAVVTVAQRG